MYVPAALSTDRTVAAVRFPAIDDPVIGRQVAAAIDTVQQESGALCERTLTVFRQLRDEVEALERSPKSPISPDTARGVLELYGDVESSWRRIRTDVVSPAAITAARAWADASGDEVVREIVSGGLASFERRVEAVSRTVDRDARTRVDVALGYLGDHDKWSAVVDGFHGLYEALEACSSDNGSRWASIVLHDASRGAATAARSLHASGDAA